MGNTSELEGWGGYPQLSWGKRCAVAGLGSRLWRHRHRRGSFGWWGRRPHERPIQHHQRWPNRFVLHHSEYY